MKNEGMKKLRNEEMKNEKCWSGAEVLCDGGVRGKE